MTSSKKRMRSRKGGGSVYPDYRKPSSFVAKGRV